MYPAFHFSEILAKFYKYVMVRKDFHRTTGEYACTFFSLAAPVTWENS